MTRLRPARSRGDPISTSAFRPPGRRFAPRPLHFASARWNARRGRARLASIARPRRPRTMSLVATLGSSLPMVLVFFGTLLFSLATAVIALLADY